MSSLFRKPKAPEVASTVLNEPPPQAPSIDSAVTAREEADTKRRRRGRAASVLTGSQGAGLPQTTTATLLGG